MGLGAGCDGGEGNCSRPDPMVMVPGSVAMVEIGGILSGVQVGLLLAAGVMPVTMGYVGGSSGPCDCLLRISNV